MTVGKFVQTLFHPGARQQTTCPEGKLKIATAAQSEVAPRYYTNLEIGRQEETWLPFTDSRPRLKLQVDTWVKFQDQPSKVILFSSHRGVLISSISALVDSMPTPRQGKQSSCAWSEKKLPVKWIRSTIYRKSVLLSTTYRHFFLNTGCSSVYHCLKGSLTYCVRSVRIRIKHETTESTGGP